MNQENFSAEQSLQVIHNMIERAKNQFSESGHLYLLWGWVVFFCSVAQFVLLKFVHYEKHYYVWMATWLAFIYQLFYLRRQNKKQRLQTYADKMMGYIWISFFILLLLTGYAIGETGKEGYYKLIGPLFLAIYGMPTFLCGIFLRFKPLVIGGTGCWVLSVASHFVPYDYQLLLLSAAMIIAWIIPGYSLQRRYKTQNS